MYQQKSVLSAFCAHFKNKFKIEDMFYLDYLQSIDHTKKTRVFARCLSVFPLLFILINIINNLMNLHVS